MSESDDFKALSPQPVAPTLSKVADVARQSAPYLARLLHQHQNALDLSGESALVAQCHAEIDAVRDWAKSVRSADILGPALRRAKRRVHLILSLLDLSGAWSQGEVTKALTQLADAALQASLASVLAKRDVLSDGLFMFAFGKMGAFELNYSSDVDLAVFFHPDVFSGGSKGPQDTAIRVVRDVCALMDAQTEEGYVFRTDLRLRPDPSATPIAVSTRRAEVYYESVGQNWERMAWIKARPCAGDMAAAADFQKLLSPFVWRRHLDYWAVADVHAIKRMINAKVGDPALGEIDCDVKLGPGGIREIEFFAQTQQIILGGRDPRLRAPATLEALGALVEADVVTQADAEALNAAYQGLRGLEHRIQMLNDAQTHTYPTSSDQRAAVAALMGYADISDLDRALLATRMRVHGIYENLFVSDDGTVDSSGAGNLVFTGVEDDPGTLATLRSMGFSDPSRVIAAFRRWHFGHVPATRSARGQALLTNLTPRLLESMAATGEPSTAFAHFERFFEGLNAGVHLLSMLSIADSLLSDLVSSLAVAPRLAQTLARRPALLESLITRQAEEGFVLEPGAGFEAAMDAARRYHRDRAFLIGHGLLNGLIAARDAGRAWTDLAREMVQAMADAAERETERRFGPAPGQWTVMAMGSFGGGELTAGSDLDMIVLYDVMGDAAGTDWFTRFTQRLTTALSAPTAEGLLYEVDMRLRPSGRSGPVAVRLSSFERYQNSEAWTWEHMALTRMSFAAGDAGLAKGAIDIARDAIDGRKVQPNIAADVDDMRERLRREKAPAGTWDIKLMQGGLIDIEFFAQKRLLLCGGEGAIAPNTYAALQYLAEQGQAEASDVTALQAAWTFQTSLRQVLKLALSETPSEPAFSEGLKSRLCRAVGLQHFDDVEGTLSRQYDTVMQIV